MNNRPPGFNIRTISRSASIGSGVCSGTSVQRIASKELSATGIAQISDS